MKRVYKILTDVWAMRRQDHDSLMSMVLPLLASNPASVVELFSGQGIKPMAVAPLSGNVATHWDLDDPDLPADSVVLLPVRGTITERCCESISWILGRCESDDRVCGVVLDIDSPGGTTGHLEAAAKSIADFSKPIATVVTGCMCSAAFWLGTSADRTFIESPLCEVGCVGVLVRYQDYEGMFDKLGIKTTEVYATGSDLKNAEVRSLLDGDEKPLRDRADFINKIFCDTVAKNLGIAYDPELPLYRGKTFFADEAVKLGYIDQAGGVAEGVRWVLGRSVAKKANGVF